MDPKPLRIFNVTQGDSFDARTTPSLACGAGRWPTPICSGGSHRAPRTLGYRADRGDRQQQAFKQLTRFR